MTLSVVMVTENCVDVVEGALQSVKGLWDELLVGDAGSRDGTVQMVKKYGGIINPTNPTNPPVGEAGKPIRPMKNKTLGERKQELVKRAKGEWVLVLDADERVSEELYREIEKLKNRKAETQYIGFRIPYQNYVFGSPVCYGGERYSKVRLFRRGYGMVTPDPIHEEIRIRELGELGELKGKIHHHSYRSPWQLFTKFTRYAWMAAARQTCQTRLTAAGTQREKGNLHRLDSRGSTEQFGPELTAEGLTVEVLRGNDKKEVGMTLKRLFLYGPHMFWARFIKEKGYRDGWRGLVLALAFGYMEGLTYWFALIQRNYITSLFPKS